MYNIEALLKRRDKTLYGKIQNIKIHVTELVKSIKEIFPEYTPHEIEHNNEVIKNLSMLIPEKVAKSLNIHELFFLLAAAYIHDIGMCPLDWFEIPAELSLEQKKELVRRNHHIRTENYLNIYYENFQLEVQEAAIIGRIARGHRVEDLGNKVLFNPDRAFDHESINVPMLAAFVRLADELDITYKRTPFLLYKKYPPKDELSELEWEKHMSIEGLTRKKQKIISSATCSHHKIIPKLYGLKLKINEQIDDLANHLYNYNRFEEVLPNRFELSIEGKSGLIPIEMSFKLDQKAILNLMMGKNIYLKDEYAIREILKNAIDTCRMKREKLKLIGHPYSPLIRVTLDSDQLTISDNGMGMDETYLKKFFSNVGRSFYRSIDFANEGLNFSPLGELGIGILSSFMIADSLIIETKTDFSPSIRVEIEDVSEPFAISNGNLETAGTSIILQLKQRLSANEIYSIVRKYLRHVEIPVECVLNARKMFVKNIKFKPDESYVSPQIRKKKIKIELFPIEIKNDMVNGYIALIGSKNKKGDFIPINDSWASPPNKFFISNNGVLVQDYVDFPNPIVPFWLNKDLMIGDLDLKRHNLRFTLSRERIVYDQESEKLVKIISSIISAKIQKLFADKSEVFDKSTRNFFMMDYVFAADDYMSSTLGRYDLSFVDYQKLVDHIDLVKKCYTPDCICNGKMVEISLVDFLNGKFKKRIISGNYYDLDLKNDYLVKLIENLRHDKDIVYVVVKHRALGKIMEHLIGIKQIFPENILKSIRTHSLDDIILDTGWRLAKFKNNSTKNFLEINYDRHYNATFEYQGYVALNEDNPFINVLIKRQTDIKKKNRKSSIMNFLSQLTFSLFNPQTVIRNQKELMRELVAAKVIKEAELNEYLLTRNDFPWN